MLTCFFCFIYKSYIAQCQQNGLTHNKFFRSSRPGVFLRKGVLKICSKFTEHPRRIAISIKLQSNFIEITLRHVRSPLNLLYIFRTLFLKNNSGSLALILINVLGQFIDTFYYGTNVSKRNMKHQQELFCVILLQFNFCSCYSLLI